MQMNRSENDVINEGKIRKFIKKINMYVLIRNIKSNYTKKLLLVNIYSFIMNNSFRLYITKLQNKIKNKILRNKIKKFRVKLFYEKVRSIVYLVKYPQNRITSSHAYLFYFTNLKQKFLFGLKKNFLTRKLENKQTLLLLGIRNKISVMYMYNEMKKVYNLNFMEKKERKFYLNFYMKILISKIKKIININEKKRLYKRYQYINTNKYIMKKLSKKNFKEINSEIKVKNILKVFLLKKGFKDIKSNIKIRMKLKNSYNKYFTINLRKKFFNRCRKTLKNKQNALTNIEKLYRKIDSLFKRKIFHELIRLNEHYKTKNENLLIKFYQKNYIGLLSHLVKYKKALRNKVHNFNSINKNNSYNKIKLFKENCKFCLLFNNKKKNFINFFIKKLRINFIKKIRNNLSKNKIKNKNKKESNSFYTKNQYKKVFKCFKFYVSYKKNKKNEFIYLEEKRNEIISKHVFDKLIISLSQNLLIKENIASTEYVNKNSRAIRLALKWFNKLQTFVMIRKFYKNNNKNSSSSPINNNQNINSHITNNIPINKNRINVDNINNNIRNNVSNVEFNDKTNKMNDNKILETLTQLKSLRNKKRTPPVKIDI